MLDNRKYTGDVVILKKYTDTSATDASGSYITYLATSSHPAIITREQFARVQAERERRSNIVADETGRHRKKSKFSSKEVEEKGGASCEESILPQS